MSLAHAIEIGYTASYLVDLITKSGIQLSIPHPCTVSSQEIDLCGYRLALIGNISFYLVFIFALLLPVLNINTHSVQGLVNKKGVSHQIIVTVEGVRRFVW
jgi:hypothetical protein